MTSWWRWLLRPGVLPPADKLVELGNPFEAPRWYAAREEAMRVLGVGPGDVTITEVEEPPITGAEFVNGIHEAIPDAFSDLDDVIGDDSPDTEHAPPRTPTTILPPAIAPEAESGVRVREDLGFEDIDMRLPLERPIVRIPRAPLVPADESIFVRMAKRILNGSNRR